jgi:hypothetical protein
MSQSEGRLRVGPIDENAPADRLVADDELLATLRGTEPSAAPPSARRTTGIDDEDLPDVFFGPSD